jgi:hypothetical protein
MNGSIALEQRSDKSPPSVTEQFDDSFHIVNRGNVLGLKALSHPYPTHAIGPDTFDCRAHLRFGGALNYNEQFEN